MNPDCLPVFFFLTNLCSSADWMTKIIIAWVFIQFIQGVFPSLVEDSNSFQLFSERTLWTFTFSVTRALWLIIFSDLSKKRWEGPVAFMI